MRIIKNINNMHDLSSRIKDQGLKIGFVPTMGYLHDGHISLIRKAKKECNFVVVSIFVNPMQFLPGEDFSKYPRDFKKDISISRKEKVNAVFYPSISQMYPEESLTYVEVEKITKNLCGKSRPGHFRGVATVVNKLFNIVIPDIAYFGQKDMQQALVIKRMVKDLNIQLKIKILPIVREKDGLALSSRNKYLSVEEREQALILYDCICRARKLVKEKENNSFKIKRMIKSQIQKKDLVRLDYVDVVDLELLESISKIKDKALLTIAVWVGKTRLIDNAILNIK